MIKSNRLILFSLVILFCVYNVTIYTLKDRDEPVVLSTDAAIGQKLWQDNNCWACHQIYGLGGYLGPDLTNVYSKTLDGKNYIKAFLNSGVGAMPKFNFSEAEKDALVSYLKHIDSTGIFPNVNAEFKFNGWVEIKTKHEE